MLSPLAWVVVRPAQQLFVAGLLLITASVGAWGQTEKGRVALVVGNGKYVHAPPLPNPPRDARAVAEKLRHLGFEVLEGIDLDRAAMEALLRQFADRLQGADVGLFYYAGHGLQVFGQNYLAPVDAQLDEVQDLYFEAVNLGLILQLLEAAPRTSLIFLDASRDNPLARNLARSLGTGRSQSVGRGLAQIDGGIGTLIAYSTQPNNVAYDGTGEHSPFTAAVLEYMVEPGLEVRQMLSRVRETVIRNTGGRQVPWDHSSLTSDFYFRPETQVAARTPSGGGLPMWPFGGREGADPMPADQRELLTGLLSPELSEVVSPAERDLFSKVLDRGDRLGAQTVRELNALLREKQSLQAEGSQVLASRLFAGPSQYPPEAFAAYGILAFRSRSSSQDRARHLMICEAYVASLPHATELGTRRSKQMPTIWPISSDLIASELNAMPSDRICDSAVPNYGLVTALKAIKDAQNAGAVLSNDGPFLLAWSPSDTKGEGDALVLVSDLSGVTTFPQARSIMLRWSRDIEGNPELWDDGWDVEKVRLAVRLWVDEYGPKILALFGVKE